MGIWKSVGRVIAYPVLHPQKSLGTLGKTTTRVVVGAGAGYVGWEKLTTDKSLTRIVGDAVIGSEACDTIDHTVTSVAELPGKAVESLDGLTQSVDGATNQMSGIGNFVQNMSSGNFLDGIGNFFSNIGKGSVSGMSLLGLVASAFMLFGRFGWFGKIAGALLGMMILGNNMGVSQTQTQPLAEAPQRQQGGAPAQKPAVQVPQESVQQQQPSVPTIHR